MAVSSSVISGADYLAIATSYAHARDQLISSVDFLFDAVYQIVTLDELYPTVDLINEFYNGYTVNSRHF